jgi:hypothetical protein
VSEQLKHAANSRMQGPSEDIQQELDEDHPWNSLKKPIEIQSDEDQDDFQEPLVRDPVVHRTTTSTKQTTTAPQTRDPLISQIRSCPRE